MTDSASPFHPTLLILRTACTLSGGRRRLAELLGVQPRALARWLSGADKPPSAVFLTCVDIVLLHERHLLRERDGAAPTARRLAS